MHRLARLVGIVALTGLALSFLAPATASAHERRTVAGTYQFVVGFLKEPALEGDPNGIDLRVSTADDQPVEGLEQTLKAEVIVGGATLPLQLTPRFRTPGAYDGDFVPTRPGTYIFHFSGTVNGQPVDERFESGPGRFNDVEAVAPLQFPDKVPVGADLQQALAAANSRAATATTLAVIGLVAGLAGLALAAWALLSRRGAASPAPRTVPTAAPPAPAASQERL
ncbi:MAG TPA: hypothetical protein VK066_12500 [Chloroflexota bacterium]|nr:hypothetical protein [Chloroflexota bacterium]